MEYEGTDHLAETLLVFDTADPSHAPLTTSEVADALDCTRRAAYDRLTTLAERNELETKKVGARGRVWWRAERDALFEGGREQFVAVFEEAFDAMVLTDDDGEYVAANPAASDLFGVPRDELLGRTVDEFAADDYDFEDAWGAFRDGDLPHGTFPLRRPDGTVRITEYAATPNVRPGRHLSVLRDITERIEHERRLTRQREQFAALNDLNTVIREVTNGVIDQSTREEIERVIVESLAESDSYAFAWIAEVDLRADAIRPRVEAGVDGYLDEIDLSMDAADPEGRGPAGRAIRTQELQVVKDVFSDPNFEPWRDIARKYGFSSAASIPIVYEETIYGVLSLYTDRPNAFTDEELEVVGQLDEITGHAIAAVERKRALMSDEVVELELRVPQIFETPEPVEIPPGTVTIDRTIPVDDGTYLQYGTVTDDAVETLERLVDRLSHCKEVTLFGREGDEARFEMRLVEPPVVSLVASYGGFIEDAVIEGGDFHMTIHLPPGVEVRHITDVIREAYPGAEMLTRRQKHRSDATPEVIERAFTDLTERQRAALATAFYLGFFDWPRENTGEDVADALGVSPPTFHQHVRTAERKLFEALFVDSADE
ncbi:bacterio-opsin activator domain-containing protein [Haladaptatus salinisoli]|uniref:bacterio-opsin activator domain-containing protein n=1 Tax=Haladaptatus salinisoli TaxID=2884876 RepID=UPI001D0BD387|nr:bacterio-opsin activator domain-containing protein [Haladaptatus salinisoli]